MNTLSSKYEFRVRWEPFLLRSNTPPEGLPIPPEYKDPSNPRRKYLLDAAAALGIDMNTNRSKFASTLLGHCLLEYAKEVDGGVKQDEVSEKLFKKLFTDADLLQEDSLLEVAESCGLDRAAAKAYITDTGNIEKTLNKARSWSDKGISGVPYFYINGQKMFSGAQEPEAFMKMFDVAAEKFPMDTPSSQT